MEGKKHLILPTHCDNLTVVQRREDAMGRVVEQSAWIAREDGAQWRHVEVNDAPGIAALVEYAAGRYSLTVVCEIPQEFQTMDEAKTFLEQWLVPERLLSSRGQKQY